MYQLTIPVCHLIWIESIYLGQVIIILHLSKRSLSYFSSFLQLIKAYSGV